MEIIYPTSRSIKDAIYTGTWTDKKIPVYTVTSSNGLNQLVGYVKHKNAANGTVLYRGQCDLFPSILPSICRGDKSQVPQKEKELDALLEIMSSDEGILKFWDLVKNKTIVGWKLYQHLAIEATLQHYGAKTRCVDFVDNHWTALWFGLFRWDSAIGSYVRRTKLKKPTEDELITFDATVDPNELGPNRPRVLDERDIEPSELIQLREWSKRKNLDINYDVAKKLRRLNDERKKTWMTEYNVFQNNENRITFLKDNQIGHMYLFLYVAETNHPTWHGVSFGEHAYTVDLRKTLSSTFLRPCSQHGWIVKGKSIEYCYEDNIACVIRINVDLVSDMLGEGTLVSVENFFPSENFDTGYSVLLERQEGTNIPARDYKKILPKNTIDDSFSTIKG